MDVIERELKVIVSEEDTSAFEEWYESIRDTPTRLRIRARLTRVQDGVTVVFLLAGGDKSTQIVDIQNARRLWEKNQDETKRVQRDLRL